MLAYGVVLLWLPNIVCYAAIAATIAYLHRLWRRTGTGVFVSSRSFRYSDSLYPDFGEHIGRTRCGLVTCVLRVVVCGHGSSWRHCLAQNLLALCFRHARRLTNPFKPSPPLGSLLIRWFHR